MRGTVLDLLNLFTKSEFHRRALNFSQPSNHNGTTSKFDLSLKHVFVPKTFFKFIDIANIFVTKPFSDRLVRPISPFYEHFQQTYLTDQL